ncbi:MAG: hypothetical protein K0U72_08290 [Gammaproteobacteria bacterium]|nr:hypothetical protein [Gammaproteobacteria bacterium]
MKPKLGKIGLIFRLGAMAGVLLFGQQAMAIGTAAGTTIDNTVTVDYDVNNIDQTDLTDSVSFVVDRRVDFDLVAQGAALVNVTPGETDAFFDFLLTNDSNSALDFFIDLNELVGGAVRASTDDANMQTVDFAVSASPVSGTDDDPVRLGPQFVDSLAADDSIRIRVFGDAALAMLDGQVAGVQLDAIAREPGSGAATVLTEDANTDAGVENVFADADNDNLESDVDGWVVQSADLAVTKAYAVIANDLGSGLPIPGATVEYTISVVNSGGTDADDVVLDDVLAELGGAVALELNVAGAVYNGSDVAVYNDGTQVACDVEINADGDGCDLVGTTLSVGAADLVGGLTVAAGTTLTVQYQVTIADPDPTP